MLKSYIKIALRSFLKLRRYSIANLAGLIIGLASVFIISAYIKYELSYDKYYTNCHRVYRLVGNYDKLGKQEDFIKLPESIGYVLQKEVPGIESTTTLARGKDAFLINNQPIRLNYIIANSAFFNVFNLPLIYGKASYILRNNNDVVISESIASTYFEGENAIGKQLKQKDDNGGTIIYTVSGVMRDIASNTHFGADIIIAFNNQQRALDSRGYRQTSTYILVNNDRDVVPVQAAAEAVTKKYHLPFGIEFQPVTSIHLQSSIKDEYFDNGNIKYVYIFSFATIIILLIACINYINFNTTASLQRLKEIGVRKVFGAQKKILSLQFILESVLFFFMAIPFAFALALIVWPLFAQTVQIKAANTYLISIDFILLLIAITIVTGTIAGSYTAFFVSRLRPAHILKDWQKSVAVNMRFRRLLIVLQFCISTALIISAVVVNKQLYLLNNMQLGYNKANLIVLREQFYNGHAQTFKLELQKKMGITGVTVTSWNAGESYGGYSMMPDPEDTTKIMEASIVSIDADFFNTLEVKLKAGRPFSKKYANDAGNNDSLLDRNNKTAAQMSHEQIENLVSSQPIIISEPMSRTLHLKQPVVGSVLKYPALHGTIIGEIDDFIGTSLLQKTPAVIMKYNPNPIHGFTYIKIAPDNSKQTIEYIRDIWNKFFPASTFDFSFVDERVQRQFTSQERMASIFGVFSLLAIIISLSGLIGLLALTIQQKVKEISLRKVMGATLLDILRLLAKGYLPIIFIAALIATPLTWWAMHNWLEDFSYHITLNVWLFVEIIIGCMFLVCVSIVLQAATLSKISPAQSLKTN